MLKFNLLMLAAVAGALTVDDLFIDGVFKYKPLHPRVQGSGHAIADSPADRIVGGDLAAKDSRPYQAALLIDDRIFCGGSLINEEWVMTAGHCGFKANKMDVILGAWNLTDKSEMENWQLHETETFYVHENFTFEKLHDDICIVKLKEKATLNDHIATVALPAADSADVGADEQVTASGWGKDSDHAESIAPVMREVTIPTISNSDCEKTYPGLIYNTTLCTSGEGGHGTCNGDSGGPLTMKGSDGKDVVRGIVSFGHVGGCENGYPDGFTRVSHYIDWINSKMSM